jgi:hypothetical protein
MYGAQERETTSDWLKKWMKIYFGMVNYKVYEKYKTRYAGVRHYEI